MIRYAIIENGVVINVSIADDEWKAPEGTLAVASETAGKGQLYQDGKFTDPPPAPVTTDQVDAERDRRIRDGFTFMGYRFQSRDDDRENIAGASTAALAAIVNGSQPGNFRWHGGDSDFVWIAEDNSLVPMDAQTVFAFGQAAMAQKQAAIFAARALKDMDPIPADYQSDAYWAAE